jgi:hypothetical protein
MTSDQRAGRDREYNDYNRREWEGRRRREGKTVSGVSFLLLLTLTDVVWMK